MSRLNGQIGRFRVADIARLVPVSCSTLRRWEQYGLIKPIRAENGYRSYAAEHLARARSIQKLRTDQKLNLVAIRAVLRGSNARNTTPVLNAKQTHLAAPLIGPRLRALRKRRELTLRQVADEVRVSPALLSTLERTSSGASAMTLHHLATFYGLTVTDMLWASVTEGRVVVRAKETRILPSMGMGVQIEQLAEGSARLDCQRYTLKPGASSHGAYSHVGEEFVHVLEGELEITLDGRERHLLRPGDSIYFASKRPHAWRNRVRDDTIAIWISTPRTL